jgi:hypothetical protein
VNHPIWISYPLPALIYDARQGVTLSTLAVYERFVYLTRRGDPVEPEVQLFVAERLGTAMSGFLDDGDDKAPRRMFNPQGRKISNASPTDRDKLAALTGDYEARFAEMAQAEVAVPNQRKRSLAQKRREDRIWQVQGLLDARTEHSERGELNKARTISKELIDIYWETPGKLRKGLV